MAVAGVQSNFPRLWHAFLEALPWWAGLLVVVKLVAAGWVIRALVRRGLVAPAAALKYAGAWLAAVAGLFVLLYAVVGPV